MSVDDYLENKAASGLTFKDPNSGRTLDKKLKKKVKETIAHLVANGEVEKDFKGVVTALNDPMNPFSIDTLHAYIHNRFVTPTDTHPGVPRALPASVCEVGSQGPPCDPNTTSIAAQCPTDHTRSVRRAGGFVQTPLGEAMPRRL